MSENGPVVAEILQIQVFLFFVGVTGNKLGILAGMLMLSCFASVQRS
jgi:hypothetical protein